jgi:hypothetical protein
VISSGFTISHRCQLRHLNDDGVPNANLPNIMANTTRFRKELVWDAYYKLGTAPYRRFVVQWNDFCVDITQAGSYYFQIILSESTNEFVFNYLAAMDDSLGAATIGTENSDGTIGLQFANNDTPAVLDSMSIIWYG